MVLLMLFSLRGAQDWRLGEVRVRVRARVRVRVRDRALWKAPALL